jgi:hypothetical protein
MSLTNDTSMIEKDVRDIYEFEKNLSNVIDFSFEFIKKIFIF